MTATTQPQARSDSRPPHARRRRTRPPVAIRIEKRTAVTIAMAAFVGFVAFFWPFVISAASVRSSDVAPLLFAALLVIVLAVLIAQISEGGIDAKALAMLGVLSAVNAALRPLDAGTAGIELIFFLLVLSGRVFGAGFGFTLGCTSLFASAIITGGVGPWLPYQMFGCAFVGLFAGLLPRCRGKLEIAMLATYGALCGILFGFLLNLSFWPFYVDRTSGTSYVPGASFVENWHRYLVFDGLTSFGWDIGRAVTNVVCIVLVGPAILGALRRTARKANFEPAVTFSPPSEPAVMTPVSSPPA